MASTEDRLTALFNDGSAESRLRAAGLVYQELRQIARRQLRRERAGHTLNPTALVHEAFIRLVPDEGLRIANRFHFYALAATEMRRVLVDYARRRRIKIWGEARVEGDPAFAASLAVPGYDASVEQAVVVRIEAWDTNCPQHIPQLLDAKAVAAAIAERDAKIAALEAELRRYRDPASAIAR